MLFTVLASLSLLSVASAQPVDQHDGGSAAVKLIVHVLEIDQFGRTAKLNMYVEVDEHPLNWSEISVWIGGSGWVEVSCSNVDPKLPEKWSYAGESHEISWFLNGSGETFPFDSYLLAFELREVTHSDGNFALDVDSTQALFLGARYRFLSDQWQEKSHAKGNTLTFSIRRSDAAIMNAILQFLLPAIACYYLLGATVLIDPVDELRNRLAVYLSLFVFSSTFVISIQEFLPYRSSLSFPELLLAVLLVSTVVFGVSSIIATEKTRRIKPKKRRKKNLTRLDSWGSSLSLLLFAVIFVAASLGRFKLMNSLIIVYFVIPAYVYGFGIQAFLTIPRKGLLKWISENKGLVAFIGAIFLLPLLLVIMLDLAMWFLYGTWIPIF